MFLAQSYSPSQLFNLPSVRYSLKPPQAKQVTCFKGASFSL